MTLVSWGWNSRFEQQLALLNTKGLSIGRIINSEKDWFRLQINNNDIVMASVAGRLRHRITDSTDWPTVGDWALLQIPEGGGTALMVHIFERQSCLRRKVAGKSQDAQIIAANFETVLIATSMNDDLSLPRIERYITLAWDSGATPVVLLTKSDLVENREPIIDEVTSRFAGIQILPVTTHDRRSLEPLRESLTEGRTAIIVGSSGVGKSSLVNVLVGSDILKTQAIREDDAKGRHTTTSRHLLKTIWGGCIIDSPGMREIQMLDHEEGFERSFEDIEELARLCKFSDCQHETEPGCLVRAAREDGRLDEGRWNSYLKLQRELRHFQRKSNKAIAAEDKKIWKRRSKSLRKT